MVSMQPVSSAAASTSPTLLLIPNVHVGLRLSLSLPGGILLFQNVPGKRHKRIFHIDALFSRRFEDPDVVLSGDLRGLGEVRVTSWCLTITEREANTAKGGGGLIC